MDDPVSAADEQVRSGERTGVTWSYVPQERRLELRRPTQHGALQASIGLGAGTEQQLIDVTVGRFASMWEQHLPGEKIHIRRLGPIYFEVDFGPPIWWWPRIHADRRHLRAGWLWLAMGAWLRSPAAK